jgi:hypothetical protein
MRIHSLVTSLLIAATAAGCGGSDAGFAVDLVLSPGAAVSEGDFRSAATLALSVSGAETHNQRVDIAGKVKGTRSRLRYRPKADTRGELVFSLQLLDASERVFAEGGGRITLSSSSYQELPIEVHATSVVDTDGGVPMPRGKGETCSLSAECGTAGGCVHGRCCDTSCTGECDRCDVPNREGTCVAASTACGKKAAGAACNPALNGGDCVSGYCVDGVCCESACDGTCKSCDLPSSPGKCADVPSGADPRGVCPAGTGDRAVCTPGSCDGKGACRVAAAGTACAGSCSGATPQNAVCNASGVCGAPVAGAACPSCNQCAVKDNVAACTPQTGGTCAMAQCANATQAVGPAQCVAGACTPPSPTSCLPFRCNVSSGSCLDSCTIDGQCADGFKCYGARFCSNLLPNGTPLNSNTQTSRDCATGFAARKPNDPGGPFYCSNCNVASDCYTGNDCQNGVCTCGGRFHCLGVDGWCAKDGSGCYDGS